MAPKSGITVLPNTISTALVEQLYHVIQIHVNEVAPGIRSPTCGLFTLTAPYEVGALLDFVQ